MKSPTSTRICAASILAGLLAGCEPSQPPSEPPGTAPAIARKPVLWKHIQGETVVAVHEPEIERALAAATDQARRTIDDARQRWAISRPEERSLWAVKWAAPLTPAASSAASQASLPTPGTPGAIEHVWVQPLTWSAFRIEGVLLSTPTASLECGRTAGERVSFPIDEASDWIHFASDEPDSAFEGGYTVKVLRERFGEAEPD